MNKNLLYSILFIEAGLINFLLSIVITLVPAANNTYIEIVKYAIYFIIFALLFWLALKKLISIKLKGISLFGVLILPVVLLIPEIYNCINCGFDFDSIFSLCKYGIFVIPFYFLAICIVDKDSVDVSFVKTFKYISLVFAPFFIYYIVVLILDTATTYNFGMMTYMDLAYFSMPMLIGSMIDFIFFAVKKRDKAICIFNIVLIAYFVICTGTRGAMLVSIAAALLIVIYSLIFRRDIAQNSIVILLIVVCLTIFSFCVWQPDGARLTDSGFIYESTGGGQSGEINGGEIGEADGDGPVINYETGELKSYSRPVLFEAAFNEFLSNPIFGGGFYYFTNKYNIYPHNAVLELLCDTGIVGTVIFVTIILGILKINWKNLKRKEYAIFILISLPYAASYMVSGSVYMQTMIALYISIGILLLIYRHLKEKEDAI